MEEVNGLEVSGVDVIEGIDGRGRLRGGLAVRTGGEKKEQREEQSRSRLAAHSANRLGVVGARCLQWAPLPRLGQLSSQVREK
jgi:hypothetical protein